MLPLYASLFPVVSPDRERPSSRLRASGIVQADFDKMAAGGLLSFANQQLKMVTSAEIEDVARKIEEFVNLGVLELRGNTIGVQAGERLALAIGAHPELTRCLWSDMFTGRLKTEIPPVLRSLCSAMIQAGCHITELDLSDNAFGPIGAEGIQDFLVSPAAYSLETLKLNNCGLGAGGRVIASCLIKCHENAANEGRQFKLKTFVAGRNRLENPGAAALAKAFKTIRTLEHISIPQNGIKAEGIKALADALKVNKNLKVVVFNDNTCTASGAIAVAMALTELYDLEILDLGDCLCRDAGVASIIAQICDGQHHQLQTLDLSGAELSGPRAERIITSWKQSYGETDAELKISNNCFGSMFEDLEDEVRGYRIFIGDEEDDEGSLSERESEEEEEYESGSESDDEYEQEETKEEAGDAVDELLAGVGCMKMADSSEKKTLSFLDQQLKLNTAQDAEEVARRIENEPRVTELELRGNTLGIEAGERIAKALLKHPELERCLWSDLFTGRLKNQIPPVLRSLCSAMIQAGCHITELDLSDNAFGPIGAEGIQDFLVSTAAYSLEALKLNNCGLGPGGRVIASCLIKCHENAARAGRQFKLKTFLAGRNRLENPGAIALAEAFKKIGTLEELVLHQDGIRPEGIAALAAALEFNPNLRILNVQDNTATAVGSHALAVAVNKLHKLEYINFGDCLCRDAGCHEIIDSLSPFLHKNLKELDLSGAEMTGEAAMIICDKWTKFPHAKLNITANNFGGLFDQVWDRAGGTGVFVGDIDDDQGTLSDVEEERRSEPSSDEETESDDEADEEEEIQVVDEKPINRLEMFSTAILAAEEKFNTATQEESARLVLQLATIIDASKMDEQVVQRALDVAGDVVGRVRAVRRRPIPATTQMLNNIVAQMGLNVKPEVNWGLRPSKEALLRLLDGLSTSLTEEERSLVEFYFRRR